MIDRKHTSITRFFAGMGLVAAFVAGNPLVAAQKTWIVRSVADHGVPPPPGAADSKDELAWVKAVSSGSAPVLEEQIRYWDAGPPAYRWMEIVAQRQLTGKPLGASPFRSYAYVAMAIHDATVLAWQAKQEYQRPRPSQADPSIQPRVPVPAGFSYPSDYAAAAEAAAAVLAYLAPSEATHFKHLAEEAGKSRLFAGVESPSDYLAGAALGQRVAQEAIARAKADGSDLPWTGSVPSGSCNWTGATPLNVAAASWKPILLSSPSEFRPPAPPACSSAEAQAELALVKNFPRGLTGANLMTNARAFYWQTPEGIFPWAFFQLNQWVLEDKLDAVRAAHAYALVGAAGYDAFIASQDAKYAYWYPRPAQMDPGLIPLFPAPAHPSYPSNHSTFSAARAEVLAYLFPHRAASIRALAKEAGDSRIWAGIHFEMDNRAGVELGMNIAQKYIAWDQARNSGE